MSCVTSTPLYQYEITVVPAAAIPDGAMTGTVLTHPEWGVSNSVPYWNGAPAVLFQPPQSQLDEDGPQAASVITTLCPGATEMH